MDSLIVLRKPLRKPQLSPKYTIPGNSRRPVPRTEPIPPEPGLYSEPLSGPGVSFVRLYRELCAGAAGGAGGGGSGRGSSDRARPPYNSPSTSSLSTQYRGQSGSGGDADCPVHFLPDLHCCGAARAELVLELDYTNSFEETGLSYIDD